MTKSTSTLALVGNETFRRISLNEPEVQHMIRQLRDMGHKVVTYGRDGWDCEAMGEQVFRATAISDTANRFHVRINSRMFPDV